VRTIEMMTVAVLVVAEYGPSYLLAVPASAALMLGMTP